MRRAQAAMEFLTTYGWALVVVLVAMGALAYFGVWSPKSIMPDNCEIGVPFTCYEHAAYNDGIALSIRYGGLQQIDTLQVDIAGCGVISKNGVFRSGDVTVVRLDCPLTGDWVKRDFKITYRESEDALDQTTDGRLVLRRQPSDGISANSIQFCSGTVCS